MIPETADISEAERRQAYLASAEYQQRRQKLVEWEQRQRAQAAYEHYRQGERADPQPVAQTQRPAGLSLSKPWWQKAGDWLQQKVVQPVQDFLTRWSEPPNPTGPLFPKFQNASNALALTGLVLDRLLTGGRLTQSAVQFRQSADRFLQNHPSLQNTLHFAHNLADFGLGFGSQVADDLTFGLFGRLTGLEWSNGSQAFQSGRWWGRVAANVWGQVELAAGLALAAASFEFIPPTAGGTAACAALTGGGCLPLGGAALAIETAGVLAGTGLAAHGGALLMRNAGNPVSKGVGNALPDHPDATIVESRTPAGTARDYEARALNKPDPNVEIEVNGVKFDWYEGDTLLDAKHAGETGSWYDLSKTDRFTQGVKIPDVRSQLRRQLNALKGSSFERIEWRVADPKVAEVLKDFVKNAFPKEFARGQIKITYTP